MHPIVVSFGFLSLIASAGYLALAVIAAVATHLRRLPKSAAVQPPITVLKPLCGAEPGLHANLRSFCLQNYPRFEIIFGVRDAADPACASAPAACPWPCTAREFQCRAMTPPPKQLSPS